MLWSPFQPPERNRSHYFFLLACISTSSFFSTRASRPSVLSLKKTSFRHSIFSVYSRSSIGRPSISTRLLWTLCVCPMSSCLKLSRGNMYVSNSVLLAWNYRKHITQTISPVCICYINLRSSISGVPKAHILISSMTWADFCSIYPMFVPFFPFFCAICLVFVVKSGYLTDIEFRNLNRRNSTLWSLLVSVDLTSDMFFATGECLRFVLRCFQAWRGFQMWQTAAECQLGHSSY